VKQWSRICCGLCVVGLLGLCWYALHNNAVTIDAFCVALFMLRVLVGERGLLGVVNIQTHFFCDVFVCLLLLCTKHFDLRVLRRGTSALLGVFL
jgi:hypothetical protein